MNIPPRPFTPKSLLLYQKYNKLFFSITGSDLLFCCFNLPLAATTFYYREWVHGELSLIILFYAFAIEDMCTYGYDYTVTYSLC